MKVYVKEKAHINADGDVLYSYVTYFSEPSQPYRLVWL